MVDLIFNNLSTTPITSNKNDAIDRMATFISVMERVFSNKVNGCLRTDTDFYLIKLSEDYSISDWAADPIIERDKKVFFLSIATTSPFLSDVSEYILEAQHKIDVLFQNLTSLSLIASYLLEGILISFNQIPWDNPVITCELHEIDEESGEIDVTPAIQIINISQTAHVENHHDWIQKRLVKDLDSMEDLWIKKVELLPHLDFCINVEKQLTQIHRKDPHFMQVMNKLFQLEDYFSKWTDGNFDRNAFSKCNPVSPETLQSYEDAYTFEYDDEPMVAKWHIYFTPGAGRIYFAANYAARRCTVCHIGNKLPDVTDRR